jgi:hypothetical protein
MITLREWENDYYNYYAENGVNLPYNREKNYEHLLTMAMNNNLLCKTGENSKIISKPESNLLAQIDIKKDGQKITLLKKEDKDYTYACDNCMHSYHTVAYNNGDIDICPYCAKDNVNKKISLSFKYRRNSVRKSRKRSLRKSKRTSRKTSRKRSLRKSKRTSRKRSLRKSKRTSRKTSRKRSLRKSKRR